MLRLYDEAIAEDLKNSFNPDMAGSPVVKVMDAQGIVNLAAQVQEDRPTFPLICVVRNENYDIDTDRTNFTMMKRGVAKVMDPETNNLYYERAIPITLSYTLTILMTNQIDMDELVRELIFKYTSMYFLSIDLPYESNRRMRFGVTIDTSIAIERESGAFNWLNEGRLYQTMIPLKVEGAVLLHYTPAKLTRTEYEVEALPPQ